LLKALVKGQYEAAKATTGRIPLTLPSMKPTQNCEASCEAVLEDGIDVKNNLNLTLEDREKMILLSTRESTRTIASTPI
jgi:hypothetical protein